MPRKKHIGRDISRIRDFVKINQGELASRLGVTQRAVSKYEQSEDLEDKQLDRIANALGVTSEFVRNFSDESAVYNTQNNYDSTTVNGANVITGETITFNPLEKYIEAIEENKKLYEALLKSEREKIVMLEKMLGEKR